MSKIPPSQRPERQKQPSDWLTTLETKVDQCEEFIDLVKQGKLFFNDHDPNASRYRQAVMEVLAMCENIPDTVKHGQVRKQLARMKVHRQYLNSLHQQITGKDVPLPSQWGRALTDPEDN